MTQQSMDALLQWLSSADNPPVRYLVARDLQEPPPQPAELARLRDEVMDWGPLAQILELQLDDGSFPYRQKTHTAQPTLAALCVMERCGLEVTDEPVVRVLDYLTARHLFEGVITYTGGGSGVLPCYLGVTTTALIKMGAADSDIVKASIRWLVDHQRFDDKQQRAGGTKNWPFRAPQNYGCWESVSCYHGVAGAFRALAALPESHRSPDVTDRLDSALAYLRSRRLYKRTGRDTPLFKHMTQFFLVGDYRYDLIDMLTGIADADPALINEAWVSEAVETVSNLTDDGRVTLVKNYGRHLIDPIPLEPLDEPSRFLTYQWLKVSRMLDEARHR
ncbi:MAG: terpene cyclase/mutase family protein [Acidimicrobiia bacterium]|nr:terpene cyclase/mutase family protein [Acidimicrobiia bacterium]MDX2466109.1 terpene cyclase/mutase family protein [Acidimicrobiia bacterium]